jgi:hypothetical protein
MDLSLSLAKKKAGLKGGPLSIMMLVGLDQCCLRRGAHFFFFDDLQAAFNDIKHTEIGDDAVDHALAGQRQGAFLQHFDSPALLVWSITTTRGPRRPPDPWRRPCL